MIYAGCSGYSFPEWVGSFYPSGTKAKDFLAYYASELGSVEINHTFRRFPRVEHMTSWAEQTPPSFKFSFKMHQSITHRARLRDVSRAVADFHAALEPLGSRLGVVLFQLPPVFKCDLERLDAFLGDLPAGPRFAMEFRHPSWECSEVVERLAARRIAWCAADLELLRDGGGEEREPPTTASFAYVRLRHPPPYSEEEIAAATRLLGRAVSKVEDVFIYVKHDDEGQAPLDVQRLAKALETKSTNDDSSPRP